MPTLSEVPKAGLLATRPCCTLTMLDEVDLTEVLRSRTDEGEAVFVLEADRRDVTEAAAEDFVEGTRSEGARLREEMLRAVGAWLLTEPGREADNLGVVGVVGVGVEAVALSFLVCDRAVAAVRTEEAVEVVEMAVGLTEEGLLVEGRVEEAAEGARGGLVGGMGGAAAFSRAAAVARSLAKEAAVERTEVRALAPS